MTLPSAVILTVIVVHLVGMGLAGYTGSNVDHVFEGINLALAFLR